MFGRNKRAWFYYQFIPLLYKKKKFNTIQLYRYFFVIKYLTIKIFGDKLNQEGLNMLNCLSG